MGVRGWYLAGIGLVGLVGCDFAGGGKAGRPDGGGGGGDGGERADASPCAQVKVNLAPVTPTVMLLVDRSGTMTDPFGEADSRWDALYQTLMDPTTGVVARLDGAVRFGLATYTARDTENDGQVEGACPRMDVVDPALDNYLAIEGVYGGLTPLDETPTGEAIDAVLPALAAVQADGPRILVLATDGEPDTCARPNPNGHAQARIAALLAVQQAHEAGVETYVISVGGEAVGNPQAERHMHELANAGVGLAPDADPAAPLYVALAPDQLVAAFDEIIGGVRTCTFTLEGMVDEEHAPGGTVTLDGEELEYGTDWQLVDPRTIELLGAACDAVLAGGEHEVEAYFTCEAIVD
ncbi:MAG TPA: vWA domain-containing protein [Kofleriaceae bacterium]|nr:vWA domain-containing protein [Kofleriaceae bacterium]